MWQNQQGKVILAKSLHVTFLNQFQYFCDDIFAYTELNFKTNPPISASFTRGKKFWTGRTSGVGKSRPKKYLTAQPPEYWGMYEQLRCVHVSPIEIFIFTSWSMTPPPCKGRPSSRWQLSPGMKKTLSNGFLVFSSAYAHISTMERESWSRLFKIKR